jgi:SAM-dependent methyltransferase
MWAAPPKPGPANWCSPNERFWAGFEFRGCPPFDGKSVLEIGSGSGHRCFEALSHGAVRVVGVDPFDVLVKDARGLRATRAPAAWRNRVTFVLGTIDSLGPEAFDVIISEDAFEHILDVPGTLCGIRDHLRPGGEAFIAFGPPYEAPDGDHGWLRAMLPARRLFPWPWGHLYLRRFAFRRLSAFHGRTVTEPRNWPYLDLNQHTVPEYMKMFRESGLRIVSMRSNVVYSLKGRLFKALSRLPGLARYLTINVFVRLQRAA